MGCNISPVDGFQVRDESLSYLCNVISKEDGSFTFLSLPSGKYTVVGNCKVHCLLARGLPSSVLLFTFTVLLLKQ